MESLEIYTKKKEKLVEDFKKILNTQASVSLGKSSSNLFRQRTLESKKLDVRHFNHVLRVDTINNLVEVEGMTTYETLVHETLKFEYMPAVVPELKTITIGGAASGIGIESSSFIYGLVHETIEEIEILLGDATVALCTKTNEHKDLFFGFPNSYGSFGYALKLKVKIIPVKKYVKLEHFHYTSSETYLKDFELFCKKYRKGDEVTFIDGTIFDEKNMYLTLGSFVDTAPFVSNYTYLNIYYKSIMKKKIDYLSVLDYIWRWDYDWFWCSKHFGMQNKFLRFFFGKLFLRSKYYWKIMALNRTYKLTEKREKIFPSSLFSQTVIQDVEIPLENCVKFLNFFNKEIGIKPVWVCPVKNYDKKITYGLYPLDKDTLYLNFGFWDTVKTKKEYPTGYFDRLIEKKVKELKGKKSLYSTSFYSEEEFWKLYSKKTYDLLKKKYDPLNTFKNLYEKCVLRK